MDKYDLFGDYLQNLPMTTKQVTLTFEQIEKFIGQSMEPSARKYFRSWDNTGGTGAVRQNSWLHAGWKTIMVDLENEKVKFQRRR